MGRPTRADVRLACALVLVLAGAARGAVVAVLDQDGAGEGFNDPTAVAPVGGNPGTTLGAQRLNAFQHAADLWGADLTSAVTIQVAATMDPLTCDATSAVLGQASPTSVVRDFPGALQASTWYPLALANKLAGSNLAPGTPDITAQFNSALGTTCAFPVGWYYGLDGNAPAGTLDFLTVVLHELGHGLGFETFVDPSTGQELAGFPDVFEDHLEDGGVAWTSMTDAARKASTIDAGHLFWTGAAVAAHSSLLSSGADGSGRVLMYAPNPVDPGSSVSHWDTSCTPDQLLEPFYTEPIHDPSLTRDALTDIGWGSGASGTTTTVPGVATTSTTSSTTTTTLPITCPAAPATGCRTATRSHLTIVDGARGAANRLAWTWRGAGTALADFGDPIDVGTMLRLCVYDASGRGQPLAAPAIPANQSCGRRYCWHFLGNDGFAYRDPAGAADGLVSARLVARPSGTAKIAIRGKGAHLAAPALALTAPVTVDLLVGDGAAPRCWQAVFGAAHTDRPRRFQAQSGSQ